MANSATKAPRRKRTPAEKDYIADPPKRLLERARATGNDMLLWSEARWQREVITALKRFGFTLTYHTHDSRRSEPGFPDIIAFRPAGIYSTLKVWSDPRLLAWELKCENGKATPAQERWQDAFEQMGMETGIYRPSQWDEVLACLQRS